MEVFNEKYHFFKCRFCRGEVNARCIISQFSDGRPAPLCRYNTVLSIYKWFLRFLIGFIVLLGILLVIPAIKRVLHADFINVTFLDVLSLAFLVVVFGGLLMVVVGKLGALHDEFIASGGTLWGRD